MIGAMHREPLRIVSRPLDRPPRRRLVRVGADSVELLPRAPYEVSYTPDAAVIGFAFEAQAGMHAFASDRQTAFRTRPNSLAYVPAECDVLSRSSAGGEYLTLRSAESPRGRAVANRRFNDHIDPAAIPAAQNLRRMMLACDIPDPLEFERHAAKLREVVSHVLAGRAMRSRASGWMTSRRLKLVDEFIEARLDGRLTIHEVAASLGLSTGFFNRAFKAAVGKSPHDYIVDRRISRARLLLRMPGIKLADIAAAAGFASHAHMTTQFHRRLGTTPSQLRDCV
jgi:AraC family transcriptional regulator